MSEYAAAPAHNLAYSYDYIKDPQAIYRESFRRIDTALAPYDVPQAVRPLVKRLVHTCGDPSIVPDLAWSADFVAAAKQGLQRQLIVDVAMLSAGITTRFLPASITPLCWLNDPRTPQLAQDLGTTRSAAAVELWGDALDGALVAIGNAPTTLFHLLEGLAQGRLPRPAAVIGLPVGFVGAAESKTALATFAAQHDLPFITLHGTRGGSAMAASVVNAVALLLQGLSQE